MSLRAKATAISVATVIVGSIALSTTPASAAVSNGYISGTGDYRDDWTNEGPISESSNSVSNATALWQAILYADGFLSYSGIDCDFGPATYSATRSWQAYAGVSVDGIAGPNTLGTANEFVVPADGGGYYYWGRNHVITLTRNSDGQWGMTLGSDHHLLSYTYANFAVC